MRSRPREGQAGQPLTQLGQRNGEVGAVEERGVLVAGAQYRLATGADRVGVNGSDELEVRREAGWSPIGWGLGKLLVDRGQRERGRRRLIR
jgi:hypothetical protein